MSSKEGGPRTFLYGNYLNETVLFRDGSSKGGWSSKFFHIERCIMNAMRLWLVILACLAPPSYADHWTVEKMNETVNQTNFVLGEASGHCSATLISLEHRLVLTNYHCIDKYVRYRDKEVVKNGVVKKLRVAEYEDVTLTQRSYVDFRSVGSTSFKSEILSNWKESDLALLQIRAETLPYKAAVKVFAGKKVYRGEKVWAVGNPMMLDSSISSGVVASVNRMFRVYWADNQYVPFIQITAPIAGGSSGGSLYNEHGELIGVPAAGIGDVAGLAIPFFRIQEFLKKACYERVWNEKGETREDCLLRKEKESKTQKSGDEVGEPTRTTEEVFPT